MAADGRRQCTLCKAPNVECTGILDRLKQCEDRIWACTPCKSAFRIALRKNTRTNTYRLRDAKSTSSDREDEDEYNVLDDVLPRHQSSGQWAGHLPGAKPKNKKSRVHQKRVRSRPNPKMAKTVKEGKSSKCAKGKKRRFCDIVTSFEPMVYSVRGDRGQYVFREFECGDLDHLHTLDVKMTSALMGNTNDCYGREWLDKGTNPQRTVNHRWRTITCCQLLDKGAMDRRQESEKEALDEADCARDPERSANVNADSKTENAKTGGSAPSGRRRRHLVPYEFGDGHTEWIRQEESEPVAFAMYKEHRCASDLSKRYCELFWILVDTQHQRRGIASRLIDIMVAEAGRESAISEFRLHVLTGNAAAVPLYRRLGFKKRQLKVGYPKPGHSSYRCVNAL